MMSCCDSSVRCVCDDICGVKFTDREYGIIACLINGKSYKSVASMLDISSRTVESHARNIMSKLGCNSRSQIVSLVDSSGRRSIINDYYMDLISEFHFKTFLRKIRIVTLGREEKCNLYCCMDDSQTQCQRCNVYKHLSEAGIIVDLKSGFYAPNGKDEDGYHSVIVVGADFDGGANKFAVDEQLIIFSFKEINERKSDRTIVCNKDNNYYFCILNLLKMLYRLPKVDKLVDDFKKEYNSGTSQAFAVECDEESQADCSVSSTIKSLYTNKWFLICIGVFIIFCSGCFWFFVKDDERQIIGIDVANFYENFLPRPDIITRIDDIFSNQSGVKVVVLIGGGGSGKTTIAREYLKTCDSEITWEINAESDHSIFNSFCDFADVLAKMYDQQSEISTIKSITNIQEKKKRLVGFVAELLKKSKKWSLLFDNVESFGTIKTYFPHTFTVWGNGDLIITTRNANLRYISCIGTSRAIVVSSLTPQEQLSLFCRILYDCSSDDLEKSQYDKIVEFLKQIPQMPLDVSAAAYYLKNTKSSFENYLKITSKTTEDFEKIQSTLLEESINYSKTRYGIISSTFQNILSDNPKFSGLLLLTCLLDSQNIPKKLLNDYKGSVAADNFIYNMRKHSLITDDGASFSIHRSTQSIGLDYMMSTLKNEEKIAIVSRLVSLLSPYDVLSETYVDVLKLVPHLSAFLGKLSEFQSCECSFDRSKIDLLLVIGNITRYKECLAAECLKYFEEAIKINERCNHLDKFQVSDILLKIGTVYSSMCMNDKALEYLERSFISCEYNEKYAIKFARNHMQIGIIRMRKNEFDSANESFKTALSILSNINSSEVKFTLADIYASIAFNYFTKNINRRDMAVAVKMMQKAIGLLNCKIDFSKPLSSADTKLVGEIIRHKGRLSGIYNALGKYDRAMIEADEADNLVQKLPYQDNNSFCSYGVILREKALSSLRLNDVEKAYDFFSQAKAVFSKAMVGDYLFRLKMHEAEVFIRRGQLEQGYKTCLDCLGIENRERNNYCDLFFNTCYYHAAVIKYKSGEYKVSLRHFQDFFDNIKLFCKEFLDVERYQKLLKIRAFDVPDGSDRLKRCFENSLKIFEEIYWPGYEFVKYYVEENLQEAIDQNVQY